jgi:hypothetical protein
VEEDNLRVEVIGHGDHEVVEAVTIDIAYDCIHHANIQEMTSALSPIVFINYS